MRYESPAIATTSLDGTMQELIYVSIVLVEQTPATELGRDVIRLA